MKRRKKRKRTKTRSVEIGWPRVLAMPEMAPPPSLSSPSSLKPGRGPRTDCEVRSSRLLGPGGPSSSTKLDAARNASGAGGGVQGSRRGSNLEPRGSRVLAPLAPLAPPCARRHAQDLPLLVETRWWRLPRRRGPPPRPPRPFSPSPWGPETSQKRPATTPLLPGGGL